MLEPRPRKQLDQVRDAVRVKQDWDRTEKTYDDWIGCFILFHHKRHPNEMGTAEGSKLRRRKIECCKTLRDQGALKIYW